MIGSIGQLLDFQRHPIMRGNKTCPPNSKVDLCAAHLVPEEPGPAPASAVIAGREVEGRVDVGEGALAPQLSPDATRLGPELLCCLRVTGDA